MSKAPDWISFLSFDRTYEELKPSTQARLDQDEQERFDRTYEELKPEYIAKQYRRYLDVLIVPMRNWNSLITA